MKIKSHPETKVKINRLLRAPLQRVFAAWTEPELLQQWWGPEDVTTHELVFDARVGGELRWVLTDSDGVRRTVHGRIYEVVTRERISFTWALDEEAAPDRLGGHYHHPTHEASRVTVDFREGRGVEIRLVHQGLPDKQAHDRHLEGWNSALDKLERLLSAGR